jgi:hypothetical protein
VHEVGKIYQLGLFSCGFQNKTGEEHCSAGHPKPKCLSEGYAHDWTYDEPVKCACWYLTSTNVKTIEDVPFFAGKSFTEVEQLLQS